MNLGTEKSKNEELEIKKLILDYYSLSAKKNARAVVGFGELPVDDAVGEREILRSEKGIIVSLVGDRGIQ
ncbi:MAG TPA: hypothetical protein VH188_05320 [Chthoniobacterales bacterium]|nr:hypothetical protein [Chthoniobacterales bacterium]